MNSVDFVELRLHLASRGLVRSFARTLRRRILIYVCAALIPVGVCSCDNKKTAYVHYEHVSGEHWERGDVKSFSCPPLSYGGDYDLSVLLRADRSFPFMNITLAADVTVYPSGERATRTFVCPIFDERGNTCGTGIGLYQYVYPITTRMLCAGDSLSVSIRHDMQDGILPGIADVGVKIERR
ncbi:MAG: gliding motility lipoprotein GldH [Prevotella sp.]|nr:gliding motility lipoprotein GldH [Prevotella sp.]